MRTLPRFGEGARPKRGEAVAGEGDSTNGDGENLRGVRREYESCCRGKEHELNSVH